MALPITLGNAPTHMPSVHVHFARAAGQQPRAGLELASARKGTGGAGQTRSPKSSPTATPVNPGTANSVAVQPTSASGAQASPSDGGGSGGGSIATGAGTGAGTDGGNGPSSGTAASGGNALGHRPPSQASLRRYQALVRGRIQAQVAYPDRAKSAGYEGTVKMRVVIDARGELTGATVKVSSGFADLDDAALDAVRRAAPFAEPPGASQMRFIVPIVFRLVTGD